MTLHLERDLTAFGESASALANWLRTPDPVYRRYRRQAFSHLPMLVASLANNPTHPTLIAIAAAVDRGDLLVESITSIIGVRKDAVRFLIGKGQELVGEIWLARPVELLWALHLAPSNNLPASREDWAAFQLYWDSSSLAKWSDDYTQPAGYSHRRKFLLEHFFNGLCGAGYGAEMEATRKRLEACAKGEYDIHDYAIFVEEGWLSGRGKGNLWGDHPSTAESILMRYPAVELARQLEQWLLLLNAGEAAGTALNREFFYPVSDPDEVMRQVLPEHGDVMTILAILPQS